MLNPCQEENFLKFLSPRVLELFSALQLTEDSKGNQLLSFCLSRLIIWLFRSVEIKSLEAILLTVIMIQSVAQKDWGENILQ